MVLILMMSSVFFLYLGGGGHQRRRTNLFSQVETTPSLSDAGIESDDAAVSELVRSVAFALRDGAQSSDSEALVEACEVMKMSVSSSNNAAKMSASDLACSILSHEDVYGPLLNFDEINSVEVDFDGYFATAVSSLSSPGLSTDVVWSLSVGEDESWKIDGVSVQKPEKAEGGDDDFSPGALSSPKWVAKTVLEALRHIDEPGKNAGADVALSFVSSHNPSSHLTRELFRSYLDDEDYPYGILTRWTEMIQDSDVLFDDEARPKTATVDITLKDDDANDNRPWTVTIEMSKTSSRGWLIDRLWCHDY